MHYFHTLFMYSVVYSLYLVYFLALLRLQPQVPIHQWAHEGIGIRMSVFRRWRMVPCSCRVCWRWWICVCKIHWLRKCRARFIFAFEAARWPVSRNSSTGKWISTNYLFVNRDLPENQVSQACQPVDVLLWGIEWCKCSMTFIENWAC